MPPTTFLDEHRELTRRYFLQLGVSVAALSRGLHLDAGEESAAKKSVAPNQTTPDKIGAAAEPYFTPPVSFKDVSRGKPIPHSLSEERKAEVGMTRETWKLEVLPDPADPAKLGKSFLKSDGTALDFAALLKLGERHAVRFAKVMTCLNLGCPLGMGLWEGVPLREVLWLTEPRENLRRVFYHGFHNDDPAQVFRSSLPVGRVLEDPFDLPPVILCYKLNGEWLDAKRGGPVRMVVPEAYGFKSVKWLSHVYLSNAPHSNDTYANGNNDIDSPLKTFAATLNFPEEPQAGAPIALSGYAQVGLGGLSKVQVVIEPQSADRPASDPYFTQAPWVDAEVLAPPSTWSGLSPASIPAGTHGFTADGKPASWPLRFTKVHWAAMLPGVPAGEYTFRCRTVDAHGQAQPLPRPFRKSGHAAIESIDFQVK